MDLRPRQIQFFSRFTKAEAIVNKDASGDVLAMRREIQNLKEEVSRLQSLVSVGAEDHGSNVSPAIQNQSELDSLREKLDICSEEKAKLERHVDYLSKELEEHLSKERAQVAQTELPSVAKDHVPNIGQSDQTEISSMVEANATDVTGEVFWTSCPFCISKYKHDRRFMNIMLRCQNCTRNFMGYEDGVPMRPKIWAPPNSQHVHSKPSAIPSVDFPRRSFRKMRRVSYKEDESDDDFSS